MSYLNLVKFVLSGAKYVGKNAKYGKAFVKTDNYGNMVTKCFKNGKVTRSLERRTAGTFATHTVVNDYLKETEDIYNKVHSGGAFFGEDRLNEVTRTMHHGSGTGENSSYIIHDYVKRNGIPTEVRITEVPRYTSNDPRTRVAKIPPKQKISFSEIS